MSFKRSAILDKETEIQLAKKMLPKWKDGKTAKQIAEELNFGIYVLLVKNKEVLNPYGKLKPYHVYFYRKKFNDGYNRKKGKNLHLKPFKGKFPVRKTKTGKVRGIKTKHRYKHKPKKIMPFDEFKALLNEELPNVEYDGSWYSKYVHRKRSYLILHYWSPLRKSEIYERTIDNFEIMNEILEITLQRKKKYYADEDDTEPFDLLLSLPMVDEIIKYLKSEEWRKPLRDKNGDLVKENGKQIFTNRPFDFGGWMAWKYVKDIFPDKFPHFWRFNFITRSLEHAKDPETIINKLLDITGLTPQALNKYIMANERMRAMLLRRELEVLQQKGQV